MAKVKGVSEAKPGIAGKAFPAQQAVAEKEDDKLVQVRAKRMGFYGNARRAPGTVFNVLVRPGEKLPSWVELVADEAPVAAAEASSPAAPAASDSSADVL